MTPIEKRKAELREYIEARKKATQGEWFNGVHYGIYGKCVIHHGAPDDPKNGIVYSDLIASVRPYGVDDQKFIAKAANESARIAEQLLECIERWEKVADYSTCEELHPGCEKYKSYEDGWHGVAEYAKQTLNKIAGVK